MGHETEIAVAHQTERRSNFELLQGFTNGFVDAHCGLFYPNGYGMSTEKKVSATTFLDLQDGDGAAGGPGRHRLISEQRSLCIACRAGDGNPGANLVPARPSFSFELFFGIAQKTFDPSVDECIEEAPVEINSDLSGLRH